MRLRDCLIKESLGRMFLHHLSSPYFVEINAYTKRLIESALASSISSSPEVGTLLLRLQRQGLVEEQPFVPIPERKRSPLISVELEPVGRCNLSCGHCYVGFSGKNLSSEHRTAILRGIAALGAVEVTINGGEPLLYKPLFDLLQELRRQAVRISLYTNATLVTAEVARKLAEAKLAKATVSLDGFEPSHDALRGKGTFHRTVAGIRHLRDNGISLAITTMVHPGTEERLDEFRKFCREELGAGSVRCSSIIPMGKAATRPDLALSVDRFRALHQDTTTKDAAGEHGQSYLPCRAGVDKLFISSTGQVYPCHLFDRTEFSLGDLQQQSLKDIYDQASVSGPSVNFWHFSNARLPGCADCSALKACRGGCRARALLMAGHVELPDPISCKKRGIGRGC